MSSAEVLDTPEVGTPFTTTIPHADLHRALLAINAVAPRRSMVPILSHLHLSTDPSGTYATHYDYSNVVRVRIGEPSIGDPILVGRGMLTEILRSLSAGTTRAKIKDLPVTVARTDGKVSVTADGCTWELPGAPIEDFPDFGDYLVQEAVRTLTIDRDEFVRAITLTSVAAGKDDTLPMLTGINLEITEGRMTLAGTDRFRLAVTTMPVESEGDWRVLIPAAELNAILPKLPAGPVLIEQLGDPGIGNLGPTGHMRITAGPIVAVIRSLDVEFVKYRSLLPDESPIEFTVDRGKLLAALVRSATLTDRGHHATLSIDAAHFTIKAGGPDDGLLTSEPIPIISVTERGDTPLLIAFRPEYLIEGLRLLKTERVALGMTTANRPAIVAETVEQLHAGSRFRYLVMPARLPS